MHWDRGNLFESDDIYCAPVPTETTLKSNVLTAIAVVIPSTWSIDAWREKNTSGHRTRPFRSRCLKSLGTAYISSNMTKEERYR